MDYTLDCEFHEEPGVLELISIALVREDGAEFYAEAQFDESRVNDFVRQNVIPNLEWPADRRLSHAEIRAGLIDWLANDAHPIFHGWYADYDWVCFCWLFGRMIDLPKHFPKYCRDLKQTVDELGLRLPFKPLVAHNARHDARAMMHNHKWLRAGGPPVVEAQEGVEVRR